MEKKTSDGFPTALDLVCPACGAQNILETWINDEFDYGNGDAAVKIYAYLPLCKCEACQLEFTDWRAEEIRHDAVCEHLGVLKPTEIVAIRERNGLTQQQMSEISRVGRASLARWENGAVLQNGSSDSLIYLLGFSENVERLRCRAFPKPDSKSHGRHRFRALNESSINLMRREAAAFHLHLDS